MNPQRKQIIEGNEISVLDTFFLGNIPQKVLIEGKSKDLPVIITLHGGPGSPIPFSVGCRGLFPEFTDRFIMVYWDQFGCGINDYKLNDEFTIDDFVIMTEDLIAQIKTLFPNNKLILFGMSWGSVLALKTLHQARTDIDAVVIWGQVLRKLFLNDEVYDALTRAGLSAKNMRRIRAIDANHFCDNDMKFLTGCIRKYTDGYSNKKGEPAPVSPIIRGLLTSPDYSLRNFKSVIINGAAANARLWRELLNMDLTPELTQVNVPYEILQGNTDIVTSTTKIQKTIAASGNPNLHCRIIADSGHIPGKAGMEEVLKTLIRISS